MIDLFPPKSAQDPTVRIARLSPWVRPPEFLTVISALGRHCGIDIASRTILYNLQVI
jgi:hypothetical protein